MWNVALILATEESTRDFLLVNGVIKAPERCPDCKNPSLRFRSENPFVMECMDKLHCRRAISLRNDTVFAYSKLKVEKIMMLGFFWLSGIKWKEMVQMSGVSKNSVTLWTKN